MEPVLLCCCGAETLLLLLLLLLVVVVVLLLVLLWRVQDRDGVCEDAVGLERAGAVPRDDEAEVVARHGVVLRRHRALVPNLHPCSPRVTVPRLVERVGSSGSARTGVEILLHRVAGHGALAAVVDEHSVAMIRVDAIRADLQLRLLPKDFDAGHGVVEDLVSAELPFAALEDANAAAVVAPVNFAARQDWSGTTTDTDHGTCRAVAVAVRNFRRPLRHLSLYHIATRTKTVQKGPS